MSLPIVISNDFYLEVIRGNVRGYTAKQLLGANAAIEGTYDVWNAGEATHKVITQASTAALLYISSSSATDTSKVVTITGLDENYDEIEEDIALDATDSRTRVAGTKSFLRVNNVSISAAPAGKVYVYYVSTATAGVPDDLTKVQAVIDIAATRSYNAIYTVPRNKNWYLTSIQYRSAKALTAFDVVLTVTRKTYGAPSAETVELIKYTNSATTTVYTEDKIQYTDKPIVFPAKSEIKISASLAGGTALELTLEANFIEEDIEVSDSMTSVMDMAAYLAYLASSGPLTLSSQNYWLIGLDEEPITPPTSVNLSDVLCTITGATNYTVAADTEVAFDAAYFVSGKLVSTTKKALVTIMRCVDSGGTVKYVLAPVNTVVNLGSGAARVKKISYLHN